MKKDNKGYTFNLTIILMLIVTIICVSVLAIVMANWNMKRTESKISSNTYTAESAIDDIRAGIQKQCSSEMKVVYTTLTSSMNTIPYNKLDDEFAKEYHARLTEKFGTDLKKTLNSYITAGVGYELTTEPTFEIKSDRKAFLRNIGVSYKTSDGEYTTKLYTDIEIDTPKMFEGMKNQVVDSTAYTDFVIISGGHVYIPDGSVEGSVYSGEDINLNKKSNIKANKFLTRGDITFESDASCSITSESEDNLATIVANNITCTRGYFGSKSNSLTATGNFYISNDLALNYYDTSVALSGNYYGFGSNSSMVINRIRCSLDLTGLKTLYLAGVNHLDTTQYKLEASDSVTFGDSIGIKNFQFSYLVPSVCVYDKNGNHLTNPLTKEQYDAGIVVDLDKSKQYGALDLSYYADGYKPVFITYSGSFATDKDTYLSENQRCYLYLTFKTEARAAEYAKLFSKTELGSSLLDYETGILRVRNIKLSQDSTLLTKGCVVTCENDGSDDEYAKVKVDVVNKSSEEVSTYLDRSADYYKLKCNSLLSTLEEHSSSELIQNTISSSSVYEHVSSKSADSVFNYIVNKDKIFSLRTDTHGIDYMDRHYPGFKSKFSTDGGRVNYNREWFLAPDEGIVYYSKDKATGYEVIIADAAALEIKKNFKGLAVCTGAVNFGDSCNEFTGLILSGLVDVSKGEDDSVRGGVNMHNSAHVMTLKSNDNGVYPVQYLLYEAPDHEKLQQYFKVLQKDSPDVVPNIHVEDYIKVRNRVTR